MDKLEPPSGDTNCSILSIVQDKKTPGDDSGDDSGDAKVSKALNEKPSDDHLRKQEPGLLKKEPGLLKLEDRHAKKGPGREQSPKPHTIGASGATPSGCGASQRPPPPPRHL